MSAGFRILEIQLDDDGNYRQVCSVFSIFFCAKKSSFLAQKMSSFFSAAEDLVLFLQHL